MSIITTINASKIVKNSPYIPAKEPHARVVLILTIISGLGLEIAYS